MNGYTPTEKLETRISNLIEQIPQQYRARVIIDTLPDDGNPHDWERFLTTAVIGRMWYQYEADRQAREIAADAEWLGSDLGVKCIISGGEVLEVPLGSEHSIYDEDGNLPF